MKLWMRAGLALLLFLVVYVPPFAAVALMHPAVAVIVPVIIAMSSGMALLIMAIFALSLRGLVEFGIAKASKRAVYAATLLGVVVGVPFAYFAAHYPAHLPLDLSKLQPWMIFAYFVVAAPIQEELIFRGLLQTTVARGATRGFWGVHFPVAFVAVLFGIVHLDSGAMIAAQAVCLGLIAGEMRRMSGSLVRLSYFTRFSTPRPRSGRRRADLTARFPAHLAESREP